MIEQTRRTTASPRKRPERWLASATAAALAALAASAAHAHGNEARLVEFLDWKPSRAGRAHLRLEPRAPGRRIEHQRSTAACARSKAGAASSASSSAFDVDDSYAFDIDEPVELELTFAAEYTAPFVVGWDMSGGTGAGLTPSSPSNKNGDSPFGVRQGDARSRALRGAGHAGRRHRDRGARAAWRLCDIEVVRSGKTVAPTSFGDVKLTVKDAKHRRPRARTRRALRRDGPRAARVRQSLMLQRFADDLRMLAVNERTFWPSNEPPGVLRRRQLRRARAGRHLRARRDARPRVSSVSRQASR